MKELVASLRTKNAERTVLFDQLDMWSKVMDQGIDPEMVESFGWKTSLVPVSIMQRADLLSRSVLQSKFKK